MNTAEDALAELAEVFKLIEEAARRARPCRTIRPKSSMPSARAADFRRAASKLGFRLARQTGSHERWTHTVLQQPRNRRQKNPSQRRRCTISRNPICKLFNPGENRGSRLAIGRRLATCPTSARRVSDTCGGLRCTQASPGPPRLQRAPRPCPANLGQANYFSTMSALVLSMKLTTASRSAPCKPK